MSIRWGRELKSVVLVAFLASACSGSQQASTPDSRGRNTAAGVPGANEVAAGVAGGSAMASTGGGTADGQGNPSAALRELGGYPYTDKPRYMVGDRPVTVQELERYRARMIPPGMAEHGQSSTDNMIKSFAYYWAAVETGVREGVHASRLAKEILLVHRRMTQANEFRAQLVKTGSLSPQEVRELAREDWTRMEFQMKVFPDEEAANAASRELRAKKNSIPPADFEKLVLSRMPSNSGPVFRQSGFFDPFDEKYLFGLRRGEVSNPVKTGIGLAVCYVKNRIDMDPKAVDQYVRTQTQEKLASKADKTVMEIASKAEYKIDKGAFRRAVVAEGRVGLLLEDVVLTLNGSAGPIALRYRDFRSLSPQNYSASFKRYPAEAWDDLVLPDLQNVAGLFAVGEEAEKRGVRVSSAWEKEMFDFHVKTVYLLTLERLAAKQDVRVGDDEVRDFYNSNKGFFSHDVILKVSYIYSPEKGGIQSLEKQAGSRAALFEKEQFGKLRKSAFLSKEDKTHLELYVKARALKKGEISGILKADMGFYLLKVDERREKGFTPLKEVKEEIRDHLEATRREQLVNALIDATARKLPIRKL